MDTSSNVALEDSELDLINCYWRAANYLSVGQIYLMDNPLLRTPLLPDHVKPLLVGHWGTMPGLNFIYAHLNRLIINRDLNVIYVCGPGHGGPGMVANAWLEGSYSEVYPSIEETVSGMREPFRQFSFPGGVSIMLRRNPRLDPRRGEIGCCLAHAFGVAFDNPDLIVACVVGDGEAETGPLAASWHSNKFLSPETVPCILQFRVARETSSAECNDLLRPFQVVKFLAVRAGDLANRCVPNAGYGRSAERTGPALYH